MFQICYPTSESGSASLAISGDKDAKEANKLPTLPRSHSQKETKPEFKPRTSLMKKPVKLLFCHNNECMEVQSQLIL